MPDTPREPVIAWQFLRRHVARIVIGAVLVAAFFGILLVWVPYQREQRIGREIHALGGNVKSVYAGPDWIRDVLEDRVPYLDRICSVRVWGPAVTTELLSEIVSLKHLEELSLDNTKISDASLKLTGRIKLRVLALANTHVTDAGLVQLKGLTNLKSLNLDNTQVSDSSLEHLKGHSRLNVLGLSSTHVTDAVFQQVKGIKNLESLMLNQTQITDAGLVHLSRLTSLTSLDVRNTQVTPEGRATLRKAMPNCQIEPNP